MALVFVCACSAILTADDEEQKPTRRYGDGPLTADDFAAKPDPRSRFAAWSEIEFEFQFEYRFERLRGGRVSLRVTSIDVWSQLKRDKSWTRRPKDPLLLDHEQGHFDIAESYAQAARIKLHTLIKASSPQLTLQGEDEEAAREAMRIKLRELLGPFTDDNRSANQKYDLDTTNGTNAKTQAEARLMHRERLEDLAKQWAKIAKEK